MYYITTLKAELSTAKTYEHNRLDETSVVDRHRCNMSAKFGLLSDEDHSKLPTLYWLPKLHKRPYKSRLLLILVMVYYRAVYTFDFLPHCDLKPYYKILYNSL